MPRSASDATRFTATGPYASTKPANASTSTATGTRIDFGSAPAGETPQQRIARLRAAAALAKRGKEDRFDKVVRVGRVWADRAHKVTALSLLGLTVVSVLVASAGITDIVLHNRQRRRDWYAEQDLKRKAEVARAQEAVLSGTVTQDQLLLLGQERAKAEAAEAKKNKPGVFKRMGNFMFGSLAKEEQKGGLLGAAASEIQHQTASIETKAADISSSILEKSENSLETISRKAETATTSLPQTGGPLDRSAQQLTDSAISQSQSLRRWLLREG